MKCCGRDQSINGLWMYALPPEHWFKSSPQRFNQLSPQRFVFSSSASIQLNIYICILSVYKRKEKPKVSLKKLLDILFSILMDNNIFNSFFTKIFVDALKQKFR